MPSDDPWPGRKAVRGEMDRRGGVRERFAAVLLMLKKGEDARALEREIALDRYDMLLNNDVDWMRPSG